MGKNRLLIFALLFALGLGFVFTYRQALLAGTDDEFKEILKELIERGKQVSCKWDWDCRKLDTIIPLKQPKCVGAIYTYHPVLITQSTDPRLGGNGYWGYFIDSVLEGKHYTLYLQTGIKVEYKCGENGFCEVKKLGAESKNCAGGDYRGCLIDPVEYNGKIYQNMCLCWKKVLSKLYCKEDDKSAVYYKQKEWTCEIEERPFILCPIGTECKPDPKEGAKCVEKEVSEFTSNFISYSSYYKASFAAVADSSIKIGIGAFDGLNGPFEIAAFDSDGNVIAKKPITAIPAVEYLQRYGPYRCSEGLEELAEHTGLLVELREILAGRSPVFRESDLHSLLVR